MNGLYARGFIFSNDPLIKNTWDENQSWAEYRLGNYSLFKDARLPSTYCSGNSGILLLIGHVYDPFTMQWKENDILTDLLEKLDGNEKTAFWERVNNLTGIFVLLFIRGDEVYLIGDASGMQAVYFTQKDGKIYVSSHTELIGKLLGFDRDSYIERLINYRFFSLLGNSLPGDLTAYKEITRLTPNHYAVLAPEKQKQVKRFFTPFDQNLSVEEAAAKAGDILHRNLELIAQKWKRPAISMTGGCDSKTTLAAANGLYDQFSYFSYMSSEAEKIDAEAAHDLCGKLGLTHIIYQIPEEDDELDGVETAKIVLRQNCGNIIDNNPNDVRKRVYFSKLDAFDVEVKSWASEIGRAYYAKRFNGRTDFGTVPSPRKCTTLYKFFLHDRKLVRETDRVFSRFLQTYFKQDPDHPIAWQDQFFWEFRVPSWNGPVITGEHRYSYDITIPYNNRRLLDILLSVPVKDRIQDHVYSTIRGKWNPEIDATGIGVTNLHHTKIRAIVEDLYYLIHTHII